jgi:hypothetical protein
MNPRSRPLILALLVTLALLGAWRWQSLGREEKSFHREVWLRYLHGPLSDLLYGCSRVRPLLSKRRLSKAESADLQDAVNHLQSSATESQVLAVLVGKDKVLQPLVSAVEWHQQISDLFGPWKALRSRSLAGRALAVEPDLRRQVWSRASVVKESLLKEGLLSKDEILEMNALLYSLQEGTTAPVQGREMRF